MTQKNKCARSEGAVLVFALLILVTAALVIGGLAQLAATQSLVGGREWEEAQQRVTLANSRAMARQFLLQSIFSNNVATGPLTNPPNVNFAGYINGGFRMTNTVSIITEPANNFDFWSAYLTTSSVTGLNINPFNLLERGGFYPATIRAELSDGTTNANWTAWTFQVRTRNPIAAGYSFVRHSPLASFNRPTVSADMLFSNPPGVSPNFAGFYTNLPAMPLSSVTNTLTDSNGYSGFFDVPTRQLSTAFPAANVIYESNSATTATAVVSLTNITTSPAQPLLLQVPATTDSTNITRIRLIGEPDSTRTDPAVLIVIAAANTNAATLELSGATNHRRVYFVRRSTAETFAIESTDGNNWRLAMSISLGGLYPAVTLPSRQFVQGIRGGIRTSAAVSVGVLASPNWNLLSETNPGSLDFIGDQMMWLEDYRAQ
jgi:hypothetical protein